MIIYDAIILEKRVLFTSTGNNFSAQEIAQCVCAAALLVSPPLFSILNRVFPYCIWEDLKFLEVKGYIAGSKNELFKMRINWFDICCDLDTGTIIEESKDYSAQRYYKEDIEFIEQLLERLNNGTVDEDGIGFAFSEYTRVLLELAMHEPCYYNNTEAHQLFIENQWVRIFALRRTFCKDILLKVL